MDKLTLKGLRFYGYHGVFPEENKLGQHYVVDVELVLPLDQAACSDCLEHTINYADVYTQIKQIVTGPPMKLIEAVAGTIATTLLASYTEIVEVTVRVTKPNPPFEVFFDGVTVELTRKRDIAYVALGSNLGDREQYLLRALKTINASEHTQVLEASAIYETAPVGYTDQPAFLNMVAQVKTTLSPVQLLSFLLAVEQQHGRVRDVRYGPRTLDLDLLLHGNYEMTSSQLTLPHPRMMERAFVLVPLGDVIRADHTLASLVQANRTPMMNDEGEGITLWKTITWPSEFEPSES